MNADCSATGASKNTVPNLLADVGEVCSLYQDRAMRNLSVAQPQMDELWSFIGCEPSNVLDDSDPALGLSDWR